MDPSHEEFTWAVDLSARCLPSWQVIGGINELSAGSTGSFTVQLEPGEYALISEVSRAAEKGMAVRFEVEGG
ncbi:MAG TPA: hypothetical protein VMM35_07185 [Longimicrobiales bacterium]|nr:hypothetical protein [Longimicrobiales bacterium]